LQGVDPNRRENARRGTCHAHRCRTHHRRAQAARVLPRGLREHRRAGGGAAGCLDTAISADLVDPGRINIFERWNSQAELETFRANGPGHEQESAMLSVSVEEYDVTDVRQLFG
jgi:quinol monooxygenase YgiN